MNSNEILNTIKQENNIIYKVIVGCINNKEIGNSTRLLDVVLESDYGNKRNFKISDFYFMVLYIEKNYFSFKFRNKFYEVKDGGLKEIEESKFINWFTNLCNYN